MTTKSNDSRRHRLGACALAVMAMMGGAAAQAQDNPSATNTVFQPLFAVPVAPAAGSMVFLDGAYAANARVSRLSVEIRGADGKADGVTPVRVIVRAFDRDGLLVIEPVLVTIEHTGTARLRIADAITDEFGAGHKDADRRVPGTQLRVVGGEGQFDLIAPATAEDVRLRLSAGTAEAQGIIGFAPDLREMFAAGLVEGVIGINQRQYNDAITPARVEDGFEAELKHWSRSFDKGQGNAAVRAAMFLKGKIRGDMLLTLAFDSDKSRPARSLSSIKPEEFYPVYGDASVKGFEAKSSSRLFVRIDNKRSYVLYGDFSTGDSYTAAAPGGLVAGNPLRQLGAYNRTMTGARGHWEGPNGVVNAFASRDTLRHVVEEVAANGTSGPFAVSASSAVEGSEQVQLVVRDKTNLDRVLSVTPLARLNDYGFEPFSGRILLTRPIPSQDAAGNPIHLRIDYEMDQGGTPFWVAGADGQVNVSDQLTVGGSLVEDRNPNARFRLASVNAGVKVGQHGSLIVESAVTDADVGALSGATTGSLLPAPGADTITGRAARVEYTHNTDEVQARLYVNRTGANFANVTAGVLPGSQQVGADVSVHATDALSLIATGRRTDDTTTEARQTGISLGGEYQISPRVSVGAGLRRISEAGRIRGALATLGYNPDAGSYFGPGAAGGFTSRNSTLLNLNNALVGTGAAPGEVPDLHATTVYADGSFKVSDQVNLRGLVETDVSGAPRHRAELTASYQLAERVQLYARGERQVGLSSQYGLDTAGHGTALAFGIDGSYMEGGSVFSEYRLRDASDGQASQIATGVRNVWHVADGIGVTTGLERLQILDGTGQNATAATLGADYTASDLWKASGRLEWRRLDAPGQALTQDTWLSTVTVARKLNRDWTALARNYYLATDNHGFMANGWQERFQIGAAYRPVDNNRFDLLGKYEYKTEHNINGLDEQRRVHVGALQANLHPSRPWWASGRVAAKTVAERFPVTEGGTSDAYKAALVSARLVYDLTENWDIGAQASVMRDSFGNTQHSIGLEAGYLVGANLHLSAGINAAGFTDRDLSNDYTAKGAFLRLRYKFDADLFAGTDRAINRSLPR